MKFTDQEVTMTSTERAVAYGAALDEWMSTGSADAADALAEVENDLCGFLQIPLDETEQGLTEKATEIIDAFLVAEGVR